MYIVFLTVYFCLAWNLLCRPGWPKTHRNLPASLSQLLDIKGTHQHALLNNILLNEVMGEKHSHMKYKWKQTGVFGIQQSQFLEGWEGHKNVTWRPGGGGTCRLSPQKCCPVTGSLRLWAMTEAWDEEWYGLDLLEGPPWSVMLLGSMCGSVALIWPGAWLMSMGHVTTKGHLDVCGLYCNLRPLRPYRCEQLTLLPEVMVMSGSLLTPRTK